MTPALIKLPFEYSFGSVDTPSVTLEEVWVNKSGVEDSANPFFWLNSGGQMITILGRGNTLQGETTSGKWFDDYRANQETDFGLHPQSIFRLYTRQNFLNTSCSVIYRQNYYHLSASPNRWEPNGLLVMSRAIRNGQDSYYGGFRVDGHAVIKRKKAGVYKTLYEKKIYSGTYIRDSETNSNLLPLGHWLGVKFTTKTLLNGSVELTLWRDAEWTGIWSKIASVIDTDPITHEGLHALRTDFADVTFDAFKIEAA